MLQPHSLCAPIFRGKYYAEESFLEAQLGNEPSYAWRRILEAKELILEGVGWKIGDGLSVRIMEDRWVPRLPCHRPLSTIGPLTAPFVASLIDDDSGKWNVQLIRSLFNEEEADQILEIPLSYRRP
ncbi:hypothetical protein M5689_024852 [Euphorbia peplus]|nr:hypothetical protein M5689_024852 [Euphorbia peplus]